MLIIRNYLYAIKKGVIASDSLVDSFDNHLLNYKLYECVENEEIINMCNVEIPFNSSIFPLN